MDIKETRSTMVFRTEKDGRVSYSLGMSHKNQDGTFTNYFVSCRFKNGVSLENRTKIKNFTGWLDGYQDSQKRSQTFVFINSFEVDDTFPQPQKETPSQVEKMASAIGAQIVPEVPEEDLPF